MNMAWTADQAIHTGRMIEPYDIYRLEEPVAAEDFKLPASVS
jgi:L-alanine-DL-glutamate epimerase-like enolase superfamily enzyme